MIKALTAIFLAIPLALQAQAPANSVQLVDVISVISPTANSNGSFKAALVRRGDDVDLYIFDNQFNATPTAYAPSFSWQGGMAGMIPWLEFAESGSLLAFSENMSIGRNRWQQILTIAKRDGDYIVAGFTYGAYDTLDPDWSLDCDYNVLTGRYIHNGVAKSVPAQRITVANWNFETDILDTLDCL